MLVVLIIHFSKILIINFNNIMNIISLIYSVISKHLTSRTLFGVFE
jgi:hypothetical protein